MTRWSFFLGATVSLAVGTAVLLLADSPPGIGTLLIFILCLATSLLLSCAPFLMEFDARVRIAEAQARDHIEGQVRRLTQSVTQLGNTISRVQSADEQTSQAIGALEELAEKFNAQAEELAQNLARSHDREIAALKADLDALRVERDDRLAALEQRLDVANGQVSELQLQVRKSSATSGRILDEIKERVIALASRLEAMTRSAPPSASAPTPSHEPAEVASPERPPHAAAKTKAAAIADLPDEASADVETAPDDGSAEPQDVSSPTPVATKKPATRAKPRARRTSAEAPGIPASRISAKPQPLELPLLDLPEPKPSVHRDASSGTSTLVATAYIGIGNKLYVRGDGPGLSWEQGVPMQFLAIGKWGWTSPTAEGAITCRIYRNDETPMLDDNIIIEPGTKAEITPRF